uniref:Bm9019, isoform a n=1 Tax=Brugia malayi TaxID=6279 RepID=A0A1I9GCS8_BRUMA|nr:Bm9019, isoform a [Brugia malayi]
MIFTPYIICNCGKKKSKQANKTSIKQESKQINERQQQEVSQNNKSLSLKKKETDGSEMKKDASNTEIKKQVAVVVPLITGKIKNGNGQESNERISTKKAESLTKPKTDSMKANEKIQEVITQEESLPEIKEGIMEIADDDDPRYKTLYIFMDKKFDIFGPDKRKSGQPEIGTMKNISDEEFAAKIEEIKARYETIAKKDQRIEINWDTLFQAKNIEKNDNVLIFTLPTEVVSKMKKKKKRRKKQFRE